MDTPVLFLIFNRLEVTKKVFEVIKQAKPKYLYVAADGPRDSHQEDKMKCEETRQIIKDIDWDCDLKTLFREKNLGGCRQAVSGAINWFFENVEEGIILEDDCLPAPSFFQFCEELLEKYRDDTRVMHIAGNNFLFGWQRNPHYSYYFSQSGSIWGWATWRRAWKKYDIDMALYPEIKKEKYLDDIFINKEERNLRIEDFENAYSQSINTWCFQWFFARIINSGLSIVPNVNLVSNIGFGVDATHTKGIRDKRKDMKVGEMDFPLRHPPYVISDVKSNMRFFKRILRAPFHRKVKNFVKAVLRKLNIK